MSEYVASYCFCARCAAYSKPPSLGSTPAAPASCWRETGSLGPPPHIAAGWHDAEDFCGHGGIDCSAAKGNMRRGSPLSSAPRWQAYRSTVCAWPGCSDGQPAAAASTARPSGQEHQPRRGAQAPPSAHVGRHGLLDPFQTPPSSHSLHGRWGISTSQCSRGLRRNTAPAVHPVRNGALVALFPYPVVPHRTPGTLRKRMDKPLGTRRPSPRQFAGRRPDGRWQTRAPEKPATFGAPCPVRQTSETPA